ncbi:MAG: hypothetical protein EPN25_04410 [Nitrospirae bacterium]|nr:MAG: hypothetical protein EPN25_04410 [Nitrospirota bacterium]
MTRKTLLTLLFAALGIFLIAAAAHADTDALHGDRPGPSPIDGARDLSVKGLTTPASSIRIERILTLVKQRSDDPKVLGQIRHKLAALPADKLQMISSLSERITSRAGEAGTDVAYLLMTTLIILS